jgi:carbon-monoxide dehydrogenase large subunit
MMKFGIGQPVRRVEDTRFLTGRGRYVDDINLPQQAYGALVMSPHAHARITRVDTSRAAAAPGVMCVLTGADAVRDHIGTMPPHMMPEDMGGPKGYRTQRQVLCADKVRFVGIASPSSWRKRRSRHATPRSGSRWTMKCCRR